MSLLYRIPTPLFGNAAVAFAWGTKKASALPRYAPWAVPGIVGALWFVWPAVDEGWKISVGIMADPEAAKASAPQTETAKELDTINLSPEAKEVIANAHKGAEAKLTAEEMVVLANVKAGNFTDLEKEWDNFAQKAIVPGEDDDDDEDEDEDEEEEEEGGGDDDDDDDDDDD